MKLKQYQVDAFATRVFEGNPAAVCPLEHWLDDRLLQAIANEYSLSETAFCKRSGRRMTTSPFLPVNRSCAPSRRISPNFRNLQGDRVILAGRAVTFMVAEIDLGS